MSEPAGHLHVLALPDALKANELLMAIGRLHAQGKVVLADAVFVHRDAETGRVRVTQTQDMSTGEGATQGGFWGFVVGTLFLGPIGGVVVGAASSAGGALIAKLVDVGIPEDFVDQVKDAVEPGWTALVVETKGLDLEAWAAEMARFPEAKALQVGLGADTRSRLEQDFTPSDELRVD